MDCRASRNPFGGFLQLDICRTALPAHAVARRSGHGAGLWPVGAGRHETAFRPPGRDNDWLCVGRRKTVRPQFSRLVPGADVQPGADRCPNAATAFFIRAALRFRLFGRELRRDTPTSLPWRFPVCDGALGQPARRVRRRPGDNWAGCRRNQRRGAFCGQTEGLGERADGRMGNRRRINPCHASQPIRNWSYPRGSHDRRPSQRLRHFIQNGCPSMSPPNWDGSTC